MHEELRVVAEGLAARLHRPVAIDDPQLRLLAHTAHDGQIDQSRIYSVLNLQAPPGALQHARSCGIATASGPVRVPGRAESGELSRVAVPIRCAGQLFGYLWLIDDDESLTPRELQFASEAAAAAGQLLHRERLLGDLRRGRDRELLRDLLSDDEAVRGHAAADLAAQDRLPGNAKAVVLAVRLGSELVGQVDFAMTELDGTLQRAARYLTPIAAMAVTRSGGRGTLLMAAARLPSAERLRDQGQQLLATLSKALGGDAVQVAIGPVVSSLEQAHTSHARAEDALRVAAVVPGFGRVVSYGELGVYRLLARLPLESLSGDAIPDGLQRLIDQDGGRQLVDTLEIYLDSAGDARVSAERLSVHRATLYYRLTRIEELTGMKLDDGADRLSLHLGFKLARLSGLLPSRADPSARRAGAVPDSGHDS